MIFNKLKQLLVIGFILAVLGCSSTDISNPSNQINKENISTAQFSFKEKVLSTRQIGDITDARRIVISIESINDTPVFTDLHIELVNFNDYLISEPINLKVGKYKLTKFLVLDDTNKVIYATPNSGSELANAVESPLTLQFDIINDQVTKVVPEVISTDELLPDKFGYESFSFVEIKIINFLIAAYIYDFDKQNWVLTSANLTIKGDGNLIYNYPFEANTKKISVKDGYNNYELTVLKTGYDSITKTYTKAELIAFFDDPILLRLNQQGVEKLTVDYWLSVDDFGELHINNQLITSYDAYPWGDAYGSITLQEGWHDIKILYKNRWGSNAIMFSHKFTGDTVYSLVPLTHLRCNNNVPGLLAVYSDGTTVEGEGPIYHRHLPAPDNIMYQNSPGALWAGKYNGWSIFEETLTGQIYVGKNPTLNM